jgi:hypothetical protein
MCLVHNVDYQQNKKLEQQVRDSQQTALKMWAFSTFSSWKHNLCCYIFGQFLAAKEILVIT